jgi:trigger factor
VAVADDEADAELNKLRDMQAQLHPITDRTEVKEGDVAYFEIAEMTDKGEGKKEHLSTQLGSGRLLPGLETRLMTAKVGEQFEVELPAGKNAREGDTKRFKAKVTELKARVLPELNDDFARDLGTYADLNALRDEIKARILKVKEERARTETEDELVKEIIAKNPFPVPESMVERQLELYIENLQQQLGKGNVNLEAAKSELSPRALFTIQRALILDAVAKREGLAVEEEDVEAEFKRLAKDSGKNTMWVRAQYEKEDMLDSLKYQLKERKVLAYLLKEATMVEKKAEVAK